MKLLEEFTNRGINVYMISEVLKPNRSFDINYTVIIDPVEDCFTRKTTYLPEGKVNYMFFDINRIPFGINNGVFDCQRMMRSVVYLNPKYEKELNFFIQVTKSPVWIKRMFDLSHNLYHVKTEDPIRRYLNRTRCYSQLTYLKEIFLSMKLDEEYNIDHITYNPKGKFGDELDSLFLEVELLMNKFPDRYKSKLIPSNEGRSGRKLRRYYYEKMNRALDEIKKIN